MGTSQLLLINRSLFILAALFSAKCGVGGEEKKYYGKTETMVWATFSRFNKVSFYMLMEAEPKDRFAIWLQDASMNKPYWVETRYDQNRMVIIINQPFEKAKQLLFFSKLQLVAVEKNGEWIDQKFFNHIIFKGGQCYNITIAFNSYVYTISASGHKISELSLRAQSYHPPYYGIRELKVNGIGNAVRMRYLLPGIWFPPGYPKIG